MTIKNKQGDLKRQDNWKKYPYLFNQCKNLIFECQCGKKYVSFPGLYLHFQRKHGQKISTKIDPEECRSIDAQGKVIYKYMYDTKQQKESVNSFPGLSDVLKQKVVDVLSKFVLYCQKQCEKSENFNSERARIKQKQKLMEYFSNFLFIKISQRDEKKGYAEIMEEIPMFFNEFIQERGYAKSSLGYGEVCYYFFDFSKWLNSQGYSKLILQFGQDFKLV